jgi:NADH-quinone oxidoreductase subunit M
MAWCFFIAGLSALALPGLSTFVSEFLVLIGTFTRYPVAGVIATLGIILAALYILYLVQRALHGPVKEGNEDMHDLTVREKIAIAPVIAALIFFGFYPKPLLNDINPMTSTLMSQTSVADPTPLAGK